MKWIRIVASLTLGALVFSFIPRPSTTSAMSVSNFNRKVEIRIQESKVDATLTNFPVLLTQVNLPSEACDADGAHPVQNGGGDVRFSSDASGVTQLPLEVVKFVTDNNPANCEVEMWVKVPSVSSSADTSIWMWYDSNTTDTQPAANSTYGSENVWNSSYKGVWHMTESSGTRYDSTANNNDLTDHNTVTSSAGKVGTAATFDDASGEYLYVADNASLSMGSSVDMFLSVWARLHDKTTAHTIVSKYDDGAQEYTLLSHPTAQDRFYSTINDSAQLDGYNTTGAPTNTWHHLGVRFDASEDDWEIAGNNGTKDIGDPGADIADDDARFVVGAHSTVFSAASLLDGDVDELRVMKEDVSDAWWKAEYENTNDPAAFSVEQSPGDVSVLLSSVRKSADENVSSSTTLQNDNELVVSLEASKNYVISGAVFVTSASAVPDVKIAFTSPSGSTIDIGYVSHNADTDGGVRAGLLETSGVAGERIPIGASDIIIMQVFGTVEVAGTAGSLTLQWAQQDSNGTATTVKEGSYLSVTETEN